MSRHMCQLKLHNRISVLSVLCVAVSEISDFLQHNVNPCFLSVPLTTLIGINVLFPSVVEHVGPLYCRNNYCTQQTSEAAYVDFNKLWLTETGCIFHNCNLCFPTTTSVLHSTAGMWKCEITSATLCFVLVILSRNHHLSVFSDLTMFLFTQLYRSQKKMVGTS